jgi:hypothetical protein
MKKILFLFIGTVLIFSSCNKLVFCTHGEGDVINSQRDLKNFSQVDLAMSGNLYLRQSDTFNIVVSANKNIQDLIITQIKGSKLLIKTKKCIKTDDSIKIYVSAPMLNEISLTGSGNIYSVKNWKFPTGINFLITGFGNIDFNNFDCTGNTVVKISGAGNVNLDNFSCSSFDVEIAGSGDVLATDVSKISNLENKIIGTGNIFISSLDTLETNKISISGSGKVREYEAISKKTDINVSGSGNIFTTTLENLNINVSGVADIYYKGEPSISTNISGSGKIHNENE